MALLDLGASDLDGEPVYAPILKIYPYTLIGFEPQEEEYQKLVGKSNPNQIYFPYALGDGKTHILHICAAPGMTSIFEPDPEQLSLYPGFSEWGKVLAQKSIQTTRLDDIEGLPILDFVKADVQGAELMIFESGRKVLEDVLVLHVEVNFSPFYKHQPLFSDVDAFLRSLGFQFHFFQHINRRMILPLMYASDPYRGLNHSIWADAVYVRNIMNWSALPPEKLKKISALMHGLYQSYDLSMRALWYYDEKEKTDWNKWYQMQIRKK